MSPKLTRRHFIKEVMASGAASTTTGLWYSDVRARRPVRAVERLVSININGQFRRVVVAPQVADLALRGAVPLNYNNFNVPLMANLVMQAVPGTV